MFTAETNRYLRAYENLIATPGLSDEIAYLYNLIDEWCLKDEFASERILSLLDERKEKGPLFDFVYRTLRSCGADMGPHIFNAHPENGLPIDIASAIEPFSWSKSHKILGAFASSADLPELTSAYVALAEKDTKISMSTLGHLQRIFNENMLSEPLTKELLSRIKEIPVFDFERKHGGSCYINLFQIGRFDITKIGGKNAKSLSNIARQLKAQEAPYEALSESNVFGYVSHINSSTKDKTEYCLGVGGVSLCFNVQYSKLEAAAFEQVVLWKPELAAANFKDMLTFYLPESLIPSN